MFKGWFYRMSVRIKELGERMSLIPALRPFSGPVIRLGLRMRDYAMRFCVKDMR